TDNALLEEAVQASRRALASEPGLIAARTWLVYALMRLGEAEQGAREAECVAGDEAGAALAYYFGACCHVHAGRPARALGLLKRSLALDDSACWSWIVASWCQVQLGQDE